MQLPLQLANCWMPLLAAKHAQYNEWAVLGLLFVIAFGFALFNVIMSAVIGPTRKGKIKDEPYESGMNPVGDTKKRFNVRFYLIAMIFLVFDVEVLFLLPWVTIFSQYEFLGLSGANYLIKYGVLFSAVLTFVAIILVAYIYAWGKGVLKWD